MISSPPLSRLVLALDAATPSSKIPIPDNLGLSISTFDVRKHVNDSESAFRGAFEEDANRQFMQWSKSIHEDLTQQRKERLKQVQWTFRIASTSLILGIILILVGIIFIFFFNLPIGSVTAAASIISNIVSGLAFSFNKNANIQLDKLTEELNILEKSYLALHFIYQIADHAMRDKAIDELARNLYTRTGMQ